MGAEKTIERIGRPVTVLFGEPTEAYYSVASGVEYKPPERSQIIGRKKNQSVNDYEEERITLVDKYEVRTWPSKRTEIEWRDERLMISPTDWVDSEGEWQVFKQTVPNLEVRIGAIYALERIAQDSLRDHIQIMEILCAYIRENSKAENLEPSQDLTTRPVPREDIQTVIRVLGRRSDRQKDIERQKRYRLDMRGSDLSGVFFSGGDFSAAIFYRSNFEGSVFRKCNLEGTQFHGSVLNYTNFFDAKLKGTFFDLVTLNKPELPAGQMSESITMANIESISVAAADLSAITYLGEKLDRVFGTKDTKLHRELAFDQMHYSRLWTKLRVAERDNDVPAMSGILDTMNKNRMFPNWFPYEYSDGARNPAYSKFKDKMGLNYWPHVEEQ